MTTIKHKQISSATPNFLNNPWVVLATIISIILLIQAGFYWYTKDWPRPDTSKVVQAPAWQTYINNTYGFVFSHPAMINGPVSILDTHTEIYDELEGLVFMISIIQNENPKDWLATQKNEDYSQKPFRCFSQKYVSDIPSVTNPKKTMLHLDTPALFLDNIGSNQAKGWFCDISPQVRVLLIPHNGVTIRLTFTGTELSERILSSFKFIF